MILIFNSVFKRIIIWNLWYCIGRGRGEEWELCYIREKRGEGFEDIIQIKDF